jgi:protein-arginine kinase activator protein McsA
MAIPGISTAIGVIARIIDTLWPSKKAALVDKLRALNVAYQDALTKGEDTKAAEIRKKMDELRKKVNFTDADL